MHARSTDPLLSKRTLHWLKAHLSGNKPPSLEQRARDMIAAIDAGGMPLNPAQGLAYAFYGFWHGCTHRDL